MGFESKFIWMDGKLVDFEKATVPFLNPALHYGLGVFEGIRCYRTEHGPAIFRAQDHMQRLVDSAHVLGFGPLPYTASELVEAARETVRANGFQACYIRPLVYLSGTPASLNLDTGEARVGIAVWEWEDYLGKESRQRGVRANVSSFSRHAPNVMMTKAKITGNYANSVLAKTESTRLGFDEAIMLDPQGFVAECTGENLFLVRNGEIFTPPAADILEGITRDSLFALAQDMGCPVREARISRDQLYIADEVFVCGTAAEVIGVVEIDYRAIGSGQVGPLTRQLQQAFSDAVRGKHRFSEGWLVYVNSLTTEALRH
jgi:branched-chain amino acid aminotransferase